MNRRDFALLALAAADRQTFTPVQLQKLLFLLDRNVSQYVDGSEFNFQPYHYGPFDRNVYSALDVLKRNGLADVSEPVEGPRRYGLTAVGQQEGEALLEALDPPVRAYIKSVCDFVRAQSFAGLVSAIYKAYPEMKANSVFQE